MIINYTPHDVRIYDEKSNVVRIIPPNGGMVRLDEKMVNLYYIDGIRLEDVKIIPNETMPPKMEGVYYIVSMPVAMAIKRDDFIVPHKYVRNADGRIVGCRAFKRIVGGE